MRYNKINIPIDFFNEGMGMSVFFVLYKERR